MKSLQQLQESARERFYQIEPLIVDEDSIAGLHYGRFLDQIIASTIEEVRKAVVPELKEIPLQQYDYDEIPDEKLTEININRQLLGENLTTIEIRRRFTELTSEQKECCDHDFSIMLASMPPQYKCSECGEIRKNP